MVQTSVPMRAGFFGIFLRTRRFGFAAAIGVAFVASIEASRPRLDALWNLNYKTNNALAQSFSANNRNQLTSIGRSGTLTVSGNTTVGATNITVNGSAALIYTDETYAKSGYTLTNGVNSYTVIAKDSAGRSDTNIVSANLPSTVGFTYDNNGNLTGDGLRSFEYDDEDRLVKVSVSGEWRTDFLYDGLGRLRVRYEYVWLDGAWALSAYVAYHYDGELVVQERWSGDEPSVNYTRGPDLSGTFQGAGGIGGLLARSQNVSAAANHQYYHADGNGNITALINSDQKISARYLYDPFGNLLASSGGMAEVNLYRFSSKEVHPNSGLVYYGERFYDPSLQRFLNHDPIGEEGGLNLYAAIGNDPINAVDPWGEFTLIDVGIIQGILTRVSGLLLPAIERIDPITGLPTTDIPLEVVIMAYQPSPPYRVLLIDRIQFVLDIGGLAPVIGEPLDLANAGIYALRGDYVSAGLSATAVFPVGGQFATLGKLGLRYGDEALSFAAKGGTPLFRGVPGNGTQKAILGQQGVAIPRGTAVDEGSLIKHVLGEDVNAGVTSWTTDRAVAARFSVPNGTIIEVPLSKVSSQVVPRPPVPKYGAESEVLLRGTVQGTPTRP